MALTDKLTAIANAIRAKTGGSAALTLTDMPTAISGIVTNSGWTPTSCNEIPAQYITPDKYGCSVDLSAYISAPFIFIASKPNNDSPSYATLSGVDDLVFYNGSGYTFFIHYAGGITDTSTITNNVWETGTDSTNAYTNTKFYIIT